MKTKILYVEDEAHLGRIVSESLEKEKYEVLWIQDGGKVMDSFLTFSPQLVVLDIMLPGVNGYELCRQIRDRFFDLPIIFLTARVETADLVKGFEAGGTDYMRKPFSMEELVVRIENQLRLLGEENGQQSPTVEIALGKYVFNSLTYELSGPEGIKTLSQREYEVLQLLVSHRNRVLERRKLLMDIWGDDSFFNSRNLDVYIRKLRDYLSGDPRIQIQTLKGKGYLFLVRAED